MANEQQISQHGVIDVDGLSATGLLIPSATGAIYPGGAQLGPDANNDDYAGALVVPLQPRVQGSSLAFLSTDTSKATTIAAGGTNTLAYVAGAQVVPSAYPAAAVAVQLAISGIPVSLLTGMLVPTTGPVQPIAFLLPLPIPASAKNAPITATVTNPAGGAIGFAGTVLIWGFYRAA